MSAANTLGYVAAMQESGIPVTFGYISDAHTITPPRRPTGPGRVGYVQTLNNYDTAVAAFSSNFAGWFQDHGDFSALGTMNLMPRWP